jgi:hypothetical protein
MWRVRDMTELKAVARTRRQIEADIWRAYSLCLLFPMHVPSFISDEAISAALWNLVATERLPWEVSDEELEAMAHDPTDEL